MLLRFLQKGLTFHNIPLMPGITVQDDENVVYSKQIGRKKTMARPRERLNMLPQGEAYRQPPAQGRSPRPQAGLCLRRPGFTEGFTES